MLRLALAALVAALAGCASTADRDPRDPLEPLNRRVYRFNDKGEKIYLESPDREKSIADSQKSLRDLNCAGAPAS